MLSVSLVTLVAFASADLKVLPFRQADLDNVTLGVLPSHLTKGVLMPPTRLSPMNSLNRLSPMNSRMPQQRPDVTSQWMRTWSPLASPNAGPQMTSVNAAAGAPRAVAAAASSDTNVFGEQLQGCVKEGDLCEYSSDDPKICVRTGKFTMRFNCKSVWEANWKPFRKTGGDIVPPGEQLPAVGDTTKCEAISSEVLDSQYSKDVYDNFWLSVTVGKYKEIQRPGMGSNDAFSYVVNEEVPKKSVRARRFRKSIDFICRTCALYAESDTAKSTLDSKCKAMGWSENALDEPPPMATSPGRGAKETGKEDAKPAPEPEEAEPPKAEAKADEEELAQTSPSFCFPFTGFVGGAIVGGGVTFMMVTSTFILARFRKRTSSIDGSAFQPLAH